MKKILIYNDDGCSNQETYMDEFEKYYKNKSIKVFYVSADDIIKNNVLSEDVFMFVMPGGAANPYREKLKCLGNKTIFDYVNNGGTYLGICAGAYYACRDTEFEKGVPNLEVVEQYGLNLIEAKAKGTLAKEFDIPNFTKDFSTSFIAPIIWQETKEELSAYYHGGPLFELYDNKQKVLATYKDVKGSPPAIVYRKIGKGQAVVSGVHFERTAKSLYKFLNKEAHSLAKELEKKEVQREKLMNNVFESFER